jgi:hypothetical protein
MKPDKTDRIEYSQTHLEDFGTSNSVPAVETVLYEGAPDIITVEDIANELGITESRARAMLEDAIEYGTPRIDVIPVGNDVYHVQKTP